MKVALDTNVFVSGIFFSGPPFQILQAWRDGKIQLMVSPEIQDEYRRVGEILAEEHPAIDPEPMLEYVIQNAVVFSAPPLWQAEVISLSAATGICSKCQDIKTLKF